MDSFGAVLTTLYCGSIGEEVHIQPSILGCHQSIIIWQCGEKGYVELIIGSRVCIKWKQDEMESS